MHRHESLNRLIGKIYDRSSRFPITQHVCFHEEKYLSVVERFVAIGATNCAPRAVIRIQSREKETEGHVDAFTLPRFAAFSPLDEKSKSNSNWDELSFRNGIVLKYDTAIKDTNLTLFFNLILAFNCIRLTKKEEILEEKLSFCTSMCTQLVLMRRLIMKYILFIYFLKINIQFFQSIH